MLTSSFPVIDTTCNSKSAMQNTLAIRIPIWVSHAIIDILPTYWLIKTFAETSFVLLYDARA